MKILHISDIHGDKSALNAVKRFAQKRRDLELILATGDFPGICLDTDSSNTMNKSFNFILNSVKVKSEEPVSFDYIIDRILKDSDAPSNLRNAAQFYKLAEETFDANAEKEYKDIAGILSEFPQEVLTVPGNWDSPQYAKFLSEYDIHAKHREISQINFAGYGKSGMAPMFIPPTRRASFNEDESYEFLCNSEADVVLVHEPPRGFQDKIRANEYGGNFSTLSYMYKECPVLILSGHCHGARGISEAENGTIVSNSGNLGKYFNEKQHGTFTEIELTSGEAKPLKFYKVDGNSIITL